jgi:L-alanine-DL-glutamate epimerase-like enolase superfamily enzyme
MLDFRIVPMGIYKRESCAMKIKQVKTTLLSIPLKRELATSIHRVNKVETVLVEAITESEVEGFGLVFTFSRNQTRALKAMIEDLAQAVVGEEVEFVEKIWEKMWKRINFVGWSGLPVMALGAIDMALWDIVGKLAEMPLYKLFGGYRNRLLLYHSGGQWLSYSKEDLIAEAKEFVGQGFKAFKMRIGKPTMKEDLDRVEAVRKIIGDHILLSVDANQGFTVHYAIEMGKRLDDYNLYWYEEPVPANDLEGSARVAEAVNTPLASGETVYVRDGILQMLQHRAADILMPDLARMGGITEWRKAAILADSFHVPVSPHIYTEFTAHAAAASPNVTICEYMPWFDELMVNPFKVEDGYLILPEEPGLGLTLDRKTVEKYAVR